MTSPCTTCVADDPCPCPQFLAWWDTANPADPEPARCHVCDDADWLALSGEDFAAIAARLGVLPKSLDRHLRRHGREDLIPRRTA